MARQASPTLRRCELGTRLRRLRLDQGKTAEDVGQALMVSATKITRPRDRRPGGQPAGHSGSLQLLPGQRSRAGASHAPRPAEP